MDTGNPLCVSELLSSLHHSINGCPHRPRCALSASLTFGFLLPIACYCQLIGVEMINASGVTELPSLFTWQLVGDAGNCYQKCNCYGFQQSSLVFLLWDTRYLPFFPGLRRRTTCEVNPSRCPCRGALGLGARWSIAPRGAATPLPGLPKARVPPGPGTEQPLGKLIARVLLVSHQSRKDN